MKPFFNELRVQLARRWILLALVGFAVLTALLHSIFQPAWIAGLTGREQALLWTGIIGLVILVSWMVAQNQQYQEEKIQMARRLDAAESLVRVAYQRLDAIFRISQKFVEASDENEVVDLVLNIAVDLVGATGASFVPIDEHGQPMAAISRGVVPFPAMPDWIEYLASPSIRDRCRQCDQHGALATSCPLLNGPFTGAIGMFCLPLRRDEREFGVLNLYMPNIEKLDQQTQSFLRAMVDETALALEGVRLRRRELAALRQMQSMKQKTDFSALLNSLLESVHSTLEADMARLVVARPAGQHNPVTISLGEIPTHTLPFIEGILQGVWTSGEPVLLGDVAGEPGLPFGIQSIIAVPLLSSERVPIGALLTGSRKAHHFTQRQLILLQTIAGQAAQVVQNAGLLAELEYKTLVQERTRLAREIHDGLAQTLGFLKLHVAQMQNQLSRKDLERLRQNADLLYTTLSEAYQDVRQTIDGLRITPAESGLEGWLKQTVQDFEDLSGLPVKLEVAAVKSELVPEVQAQLIRIVQEALSNIRKHAGARQVWVTCLEEDGDLWLEIRDDGKGFSPEDVSGPSQHGLRGMRERAELVGADFQVISHPGQGAAVRIRLPLSVIQQGERYL